MSSRELRCAEFRQTCPVHPWVRVVLDMVPVVDEQEIVKGLVAVECAKAEPGEIAGQVG